MVADLVTGEFFDITPEGYADFATPSYSPDGTQIIVSAYSFDTGENGVLTIPTPISPVQPGAARRQSRPTLSKAGKRSSMARWTTPATVSGPVPFLRMEVETSSVVRRGRVSEVTAGSLSMTPCRYDPARSQRSCRGPSSVPDVRSARWLDAHGDQVDVALVPLDVCPR